MTPHATPLKPTTREQIRNVGDNAEEVGKTGKKIGEAIDKIGDMFDAPDAKP